VARRGIRKAIELVKGDLRQIDYGHIDAVLQLARSTEGSGRIQIPGVDVFRSFDLMRLAKAGASPPPRDYSFAVSPPCAQTLPDGNAISFEIREIPLCEPPCDKLGDSLDWSEVSALPELKGGALELRNWRPGDRYRPTGHKHEQKIKQMFQDARIPLWERRHWPVLAAGGRVIWTRRFGAADGLEGSAKPGAVLCIRETQQPISVV
jgi:tRNA(Ile)-lysidine synthase